MSDCNPDRPQEDLKKLLQERDERVKELGCMYSVAESVRSDGPLERILQEVAEALPRGWHYPEIARGRVQFGALDCISEPFEPTLWRQASEIVVHGRPQGVVEVYYLEEYPELDEGPFLIQERDLIDGIANTVAEAIERRLAEVNQRRLAAVVHNSSDAITVQDLEGNITAWNIGAERMYGWTEPEALGMNIRNLLPEDVQPESRELIEALRRGETIESLEGGMAFAAPPTGPSRPRW
jgi:PAS domain-containing protein